MLNEILKAKKAAWENSPLIHSITNPISINDCANFVLSAGGKPIMAEHPAECADITKTASVLALNIANITDARMQSIKISAKTAENCGIPSIIDAVGVTCSKLRLDYINALLADTHVSAIKGNIAEIRALLGKHTDTVGIDVKKSERNVAEDTEDAKTLAKKYNCVVMASGKTDIITDGEKTTLVTNGRPEMSLVTGTGCVLNVLAATYMSQTGAFVGCVSAAVIFGICGELADCKNGMASYRMNMLDKLYTLTDEEIRANIKLYVEMP